MNTYAITVEDELFGEFDCEITAATEDKAIEIAKDQYAFELGTFEENINILSINQIFV